MDCIRCNSKRVASVSAKCGDLFNVDLSDASRDGYVPRDLGIGGGDYVNFSYCLDCGQMQGAFPLMPTEIEDEEER